MKTLINFLKPLSVPHPSTVTQDAIRVTEKGIAELKNSLVSSLKLLADLRSMSAQLRDQLTENISEAEKWDKKAMQALEKVQLKKLTSDEADKVVTEALIRKEECMEQVYRTIKDKEKYAAAVTQMEQNIQKIMDTINKWEDDLEVLRNRLTEIAAIEHPDVNIARKELSDAMVVLERMREKAGLEHALSELDNIVKACKNKVASSANQPLKLIPPTNFQANIAIESLKYKMMMTKRIKEESSVMLA